MTSSKLSVKALRAESSQSSRGGLWRKKAISIPGKSNGYQGTHRLGSDNIIILTNTGG